MNRTNGQIHVNKGIFVGMLFAVLLCMGSPEKKEDRKEEIPSP